MAEILALDWGGKAGACWELWKCEPCCGEPCNAKEGAMCALCWLCPTGILAGAKLMAYSQGRDCAIVNHVGLGCVGCIAAPTLRHNLRVRAKVGNPPMEKNGLIGDIILSLFCGLCAGTQELRSVDKSAWDWVAEYNEKGIKFWEPPCTLCIDHV